MESAKIEPFRLPDDVSRVTSLLNKEGYEAYLVGGCVRDLLMGRTPKDWDVTTNATPDQIISIFPNSFYENKFGTVGIVRDDSDDKTSVSDETTKVIEVTPYRLESEYSDHRHPDKVSFTRNIEEDLKRRDFTMNSLAYDPIKSELVDLFGGIADMTKKTIKTVGNPEDRFNEDGLRIIRAIRFHVELGFIIDGETEKAIMTKGDILAQVSRERIRDELIKIIMSDHPMDGFLIMQKLHILKYIVPKLEEAIGVEQNQAHAFDVWTHLLKSLQHAADKKYPLHVRLAALFHDISKPECRRWNNEAKQWTFYGHEVVGSRVTEEILDDLRFSRETIEKVIRLVRWHMFFSDTESITHSAVRRMVANVGKENVWDLINVRLCDRIGTGRPKENPYRLRKYQAMIEEVMEDPVSLSMLKINGQKIMEVTQMQPGPNVGNILHALFDEVIEDPLKNNEEYLINRAKELSVLDTNELKKLGKKGKEIMENKEEERVKDIRGKHFVE